MRRRRGAMLLEILMALSLFVTAGSIILVSTTSMTAALGRSRDQQIATDLAVSMMAQLEAGLTTAERLHDTLVDVDLLSTDNSARLEAMSGQPKRWRIVVETEQSRFSPLTNVTIRIFDARGARAGDETELAVVHQLVRLNASSPDEFESDPMLDGAAMTTNGGGG